MRSVLLRLIQYNGFCPNKNLYSSFLVVIVRKRVGEAIQSQASSRLHIRTSTIVLEYEWELMDISRLLMELMVSHDGL